MLIRDLRDDEQELAGDVLTRRWGAPLIARRAQLIDASRLPALVAEVDGTITGLLTYSTDRSNFEVVTLDAFEPGQGVGSALLRAAIDRAAGLGCERLWLITTNDNVEALGFYVRHGLRVVAVHFGAVTVARMLKPSIPEVGAGGIPITDELELELWIDALAPASGDSAA